MALRLTIRRIDATLAVVGALLHSAGSAWADWDDGVAATDRGDYATAFREFLPLAEQDHAAARFNLGFMYDKGLGVPENDVKAVKLYRKAAEQSHAGVQYNLDIMYDNGEGVSENNTEAVKWDRKAAEQGLADAQHNLGNKYYNGEGVPVNYVKACMWWSLAKAQSNEHASDNLDIIKEEMSHAQIAKAQKLAAEWWEKHNKRP